MTIRADIICHDPMLPKGWVEVDPFDYAYSGPDPNGNIESYLSKVADGTHTFHWPTEDDAHTSDYPPGLILIALKSHLQGFDPVWYVDLPDDFEVTSITYSEPSNCSIDKTAMLIECPECSGRNTRDEYHADTEYPESGQHVRCPNCRAAVCVSDLIEVNQ